MRFWYREAGPHWRGCETLAKACERARLSVDQAEAARLASQSLTVRGIAIALSSLLNRPVGYQQAGRKVVDAENHLRRAHPELVALHRREMRALLRCLRNVRPSNPGLAVYRERLGVHDKEPVRFHSKLAGELPDDLMYEPCRFVRDLPELLRLQAEEDESRAAGP